MWAMTTLSTDTDRSDLLGQIKDHAVVHGEVTLASGRTADYYVDLRRITLSAAAAPLIGRVMWDLTADLDFSSVGGPTLQPSSGPSHRAGGGGSAPAET